ncbi:MAG: peptidoglycan DD-metalloendopeptidase family protein [Pseudomonadota bacterium]|nr:peptidoglycan DD-metalloendopeptidase family protein [Pseudomonadota bacterium]
MKWLLVFLAGALVGANAVFFLMTRDAPAPGAAAQGEVPVQPAAPATDTPSRPPSALPGTSPGQPTDAKPPQRRQTAPLIAAPGKLIVPVQGIAAAQLSDTFEDARGSDRVHDAMDILAPHGTPVFAVADGHVEKLFNSKQGGLTLYQFEPSGTYVYYYAHLDAYAKGMVEGKPLRQGEVIGYVGSTGNADVAAPHLHFAVSLLGPEKQWWKAAAINPYPLLGGK